MRTARPCNVNRKHCDGNDNVDMRKIVLIEVGVIIGWFLFYSGAWSLLDKIGLNNFIVINVIFMVAGIVIILGIVFYTRKSSYS